MKKIILSLLVFVTTVNFAQSVEKKYKYVIVPVQYGFTSKPNEFQLNVLTRVKLKEEGFKVYMNEGEELPNELSKNQCLALKAHVIKESGVFTTTLIFQLKDCFGKLIFESEGKSREKDYKDAYQEALRIALQDFQIASSLYLKKDNTEDKAEISEITKIEKSELSFGERTNIYRSDNKTYWLLKNADNYILYEDKGDTILATLNMADRGTYTFDSADVDGVAYFNANGDIIVEYLAKDKDTVQKIVFTKE